MEILKFQVLNEISTAIERMNKRNEEFDLPHVQVKSIWANYTFNLSEDLKDAKDLKLYLVFDDSSFVGDIEIGIMQELQDNSIIEELDLVIGFETTTSFLGKVSDTDIRLV